MKSIHLLSTVAIVVAFVGFFFGTRDAGYEEAYKLGVPEAHDESEPSETDGDIEAARSYGDLMESPYDKNEHFRQSIAALEDRIPSRSESIETSDDVEAALADRAKNRASTGAPPTVPHKIEQRGALGCLSCHQNGVEVDGEVARPMSHEFMVNCTQCHVPGKQASPLDDPDPDAIPVATKFEPQTEPTGGPTAWPGAPPQMPHRTQMRERCVSCHGPAGRRGIRTDHPNRRSCTQCHTPSARLERRPMMDLPVLAPQHD